MHTPDTSFVATADRYILQGTKYSPTEYANAWE